jgi:hypothetical protein
MKHQPWFLTVLLVSLVIPSILLSSEIERARVAEVVNRAAGSTLEIPEALSISRDVETEEKCIRLGLGLGPWTDTQPPLFRFYRVVEGAFAIEDGEIVMRSFMLGTPREWVVAIRNSDGKLYRIKGFDGSQSEQPSFSDLVRDLSIKVAVEEDATQTLGFYWFATRGRELRRTILSEMHLRGLATADFAEQCPPRDARKIFRKWWNKGIAGFAKRSRFRMPVVKRNNVFHVQYVFYAQGGVWEETAAVAPNGLIEIISERKHGARAAVEACSWEDSYF